MAENSQRFRFTSANAREMAQRSAEARRKRREQADSNADARPRSSLDDAAYVAERITSAREQIERLTGRAGKETDPLNLERLARAMAQWSEQERVLSGRPLPGSRKPGEAKPAKEAEIMPL
jgi:2-keto-4-pentenoate hydratase